MHNNYFCFFCSHIINIIHKISRVCKRVKCQEKVKNPWTKLRALQTNSIIFTLVRQLASRWLYQLHSRHHNIDRIPRRKYWSYVHKKTHFKHRCITLAASVYWRWFKYHWLAQTSCRKLNWFDVIYTPPLTCRDSWAGGRKSIVNQFE